MPLDGSSFIPVDRIKQLIQFGWTQGQASDGYGFCLYGAVREATHGWDGNELFQTTLERTAYALGWNGEGNPIYEITKWNDAPGRTQAEALALMDKVTP